MVREMKVSALKMHNQVAVYADTDTNMNESHSERVVMEIGLQKTINRMGAKMERGGNTKDINLRTTRHYYAGKMILRLMRKNKLKQQEEKFILQEMPMTGTTSFQAKKSD